MKLHFHRYISLAILFAAICIIYVSLLIKTQSMYSSDTTESDEYTVTYETVYAVRGEIFDRNGVPLCKNLYKYSLVLEYDSRPSTKREMNDLFLYAERAVTFYGYSDKVSASLSPFTGMYPNISYDVEKLDNKSVSANLDYVKRIYGITENECSKVVDLLVHYYGLLALDENGERVYSDEEITLLLSKRYDCDAKKFGPNEPYVFCKDVGEDIVLDIREKNISGLNISVECKRYYPNDGVATHVLGRIGRISAEKWDYYKALGYSIEDTVGLDGAEEAFESYLRGVNGKKKIVKDKNGVIISEEMVEEPKKGNDVYLTIDVELQITAQQALIDTIEYTKSIAKPTSANPGGADCGAASMVVMDPDTFEILAIASYPSYTMEEYENNYETLVKDENKPLYFRALNGTYAPGSTFKVGVAVAALENGTISVNSTIDTTSGAYIKNGVYKYYKSYQPTCWIKNMYGSSHGVQDVQAAIKNSCNCFFFEVGRLMGIDTLNEYCTLYGLGQKTGIELKESVGILASPSYKEDNNIDDGIWYESETIISAIGQSYNSFTPLQLCSYVSMLMNGGNRYNAHILGEVKEFGSNDLVAKQTLELLSSLEISESTLEAIKAGMNEVRTSQSNTSKHFKDCPVEVMIKTGTAEIGGNKSFNATMIGFAENEEKGKLTCAVVLEQGNSGSNCSVAVNAIMTKYFGTSNTEVGQ